MHSPFILRFQEPCILPDDCRSNAGTQTITNVRAEAMDSNPDRRQHGAFGGNIPAGTHTATFVRAEHGDTDPDRLSYGVFGRHIAAGKITGTAVKAEQSDVASGTVEISGMPTGAGSRSLGTRTCTKVLAEQADEDPGRRHLYAIPQCSSS